MGRRALGWLEHSCWAIATALAGGLPRSASPCRWFWLRLAGGPNINNRGRQGLSSNSGSFWQSGFDGDAGVLALGALHQRVNNPRPLSQSSPSLSCRTSHMRPSRPSREGFGVGVQVRGWGEAWFWVVHSEGVVLARLPHTQEDPGSIPGRGSYLRQVSLH